jgi:peptidoglycan/LPS O-acetylase OafA/YrhL
MKRLAYVDALRGYAILMVFAAHTTHSPSDLSPLTNTILEQTARGV